MESDHVDDLRATVYNTVGHVEETFNVEVDVILRGDHKMSDRLGSLVVAIREALINAARHAGVARLYLYMEASDEAVHAIIEDNGMGFDPEAVDLEGPGRMTSIIGPMEQAGGSAVIRSTPGAGTNVILTMPLKGTPSDTVPMSAIERLYPPGWSFDDPRFDDPRADNGPRVREPRRPTPSAGEGSAALDPPD